MTTDLTPDEVEARRIRGGRPRAQNPKDIKICIAVDKAMRQDLDAICERVGMDHSQYIRRAIRETTIRDSGL